MQPFKYPETQSNSVVGLWPQPAFQAPCLAPSSLSLLSGHTTIKSQVPEHPDLLAFILVIPLPANPSPVNASSSFYTLFSSTFIELVTPCSIQTSVTVQGNYLFLNLPPSNSVMPQTLFCLFLQAQGLT